MNVGRQFVVCTNARNMPGLQEGRVYELIGYGLMTVSGREIAYIKGERRAYNAARFRLLPDSRLDELRACLRATS